MESLVVIDKIFLFARPERLIVEVTLFLRTELTKVVNGGKLFQSLARRRDVPLVILDDLFLVPIVLVIFHAREVVTDIHLDAIRNKLFCGGQIFFFRQPLDVCVLLKRD